MTLHYEQIWFMIDCERITSKFCIIFPKISRFFPPRYLNFHPKSKHLQTVKFLKTEFSLSFQKKEHINFISTYYTVITTYSLKESWSNSAISKKDCNFKMPFWKLSGGLFTFNFRPTWDDNISRARMQRLSQKSFHILSYFEQVTSIHESLNYSKKFFFSCAFILLIWLYASSLCYIGWF